MKKLPHLALLLVALHNVSGCTQAQAPAESTTDNAATAADNAWRTRRALYEYDTTLPLEVKNGTSKETLTATVQTLHYRGARGANVPAFYITPQGVGAGAKLPAVVLLHGKDGKIEDMLSIGQLLASRGYASVIPELVGHGARREKDNPLFVGKAQRLRDGLIETVQDVRRAVDFLQTKPEVDQQRMGLIGLSLGAMLGTITTAVDERIQTAILVVGGGGWKTILAASQESFAQSSRAQGVQEADFALLEDVDPVNFAGHISPRPVLLLNGRKDDIIPPSSAEVLFNAAKEPKKQIWFPTGHFIPPTEAGPPMAFWLEEHLKALRPAAPVSTNGGIQPTQ
ncbi:MAG TPA: acetylxylan esterase [Abditibacteriaceae bacterium]